MTNENTGDGGLHRLELNLHPNEASGLLTVDNEALLFRCTLPPDEHSGSLKVEFAREFPDPPRVEG